MGADEFIATDEDKDWATKNASSIDLIVSTVSSHKMPLQEYIGLLRIKGTFIIVGAPEDSLPGFNGFALIGKGAKMGGSKIGSPDDIREMLALAAERGIKPWIQERPMKDANQATVDMEYVSKIGSMLIYLTYSADNTTARIWRGTDTYWSTKHSRDLGSKQQSQIAYRASN